MGFTQCFCRLQCASEVPTATREYFPRTFRGAVRQRTRWVMGIALQGWERNGWKRSMLTNYWFWRDRKGLLANPLGVVANAAFLAGAFTWIWSRASEQPWALEVNSVWVEWVCAATLMLQCAHLAIRMECVRRLFGPWMAVTVPLRVFHENVMNSLATVQAVFRYSMARWQGRPLAWLKTDHSYPDRAQLRDSRRGLEEILVSMGKIAADALAEAKSQLQAGEALESYLLKNGFLDDRDLARAISLLEGVEIVSVAVETVNPRVARAIPARLGEELTVIPYRVSAGCMMIAGPKVPQPNWRERLSRITRLHLEFHLVTWGNFEELKTLIA